MPRNKQSNPSWKSWTGLVYYGEVVGFVVAWVTGIAALLYSAATPQPTQAPIDRVASAEVGR